MNNSNSEIINRAQNYPYERPNGSFLLENDRIVELKGRVLDGDLKKFIPVLAYGSNASPEQLRRKLSPIKEPIAVFKKFLALSSPSIASSNTACKVFLNHWR